MEKDPKIPVLGFIGGTQAIFANFGEMIIFYLFIQDLCLKQGVITADNVSNFAAGPLDGFSILFAFHCLPHSAWAAGKWAEWAVELVR